MEFIPDLDRPFNHKNYFNKTHFHGCIWTEIKEIHEIISDCIQGSCNAIIVQKSDEPEEIIYNNYHKYTTVKQNILDEIIRQHVISNPHLLLKPIPGRTLIIYMFLQNPWCLKIVYNDGAYDINCFN